MIIDTHCHLDFPEFSEDLESVLERARNSGVKYIINVASSIDGCLRGQELASAIDSVFFTLGIHPHHASEVSKEDMETIERLARKHKKAVAIGEVGLDFFKNFSPRNKQEELFVSFLALKEKLNLPIIIHSRNAKEETIDIIKSELKPPIDGVMHCFSQDVDYMRRILDLGLHVSFTCNITFKNATRLKDVVKYVPIDRLLLETDAPFLAPQEMRGRRNEPAYLTYLVKELSEILNVSEEEIENITTKNADKLFNLGIKDIDD